MDNITGTVFNIQRYSIDDGPGVRTTVFMKGCPLSCLWCSNPESQNPVPEISWRYTSCVRCGCCVMACPLKLITLENNEISVNRAACDRCGKCVDACVHEAMNISGKQMTVDEVFAVVKRDYDYYEASGGGVTASGGEILDKSDFVAELFRRCREADIGTCADTSGFGSPESLKKILPFTNVVLYDLKHLDPEEHRKACGQSNELILRNLETAYKSNAQVIIRVPLIPEFNTSDGALNAIAQAVRDRAGDSEVNIMPYHSYGANKYKMVGKVYQLDDLRELTQQQKERAKEIFESYGSKCEISR